MRKKRLLKMMGAVAMSLGLATLLSFTGGSATIAYAAGEQPAASATDADGEVASPLMKQTMTDLKSSGALACDNDNITMTQSSAGKGLLISGKTSDVTNARFSITKKFNFGTSTISRFTIDGLATKKKNLNIDFYLDDQKTPFQSTTLLKQKKDNTWTFDGDVTADVTSLALTGEHTLSWRIRTTDTDKNMTFLLRSVEFVENDNLPVIYLNLDESQGTIAAMDNDQQHNTECYGDMSVETPAGYQNEYTGDTTKTLTNEKYNLDYIRGRGNSTWNVDKKPYKIKLDKSANLLGMGKNKHWVLLANRYDNSKLRNKITYWLSQRMGMEFTPKCVFVDVVMNGRYLGSYYLCEHIRVGETRVNIDDLEANDETEAATTEPTITGGYLMGMSPYDDVSAPHSFATTRGNSYELESPSFEDYTNDTQYNYIKNYMQKTEDAIYGKDFKDSSGVSYKDYMDVDAAAGYFWVQEISQNGDAYGSSSTYLYKKRDTDAAKGKLFWGPLWDFDFVAWGDTDYGPNVDNTGFTTTDRTWFERLLQDKSFVTTLINRWKTIEPLMKEAYKDGGQLDQYAKQLQISERYDLEKWGSFGFGMYNDGESDPATPLTFDQEVTRLKTWMKTRTEWIDANVNTLMPKECSVKYMNGSKLYASETVLADKAGITLPANPVKKGYVFTGWYYNVKDSDTKVENGALVSFDAILHAGWVKSTKVVNAERIYLQTYQVNATLHPDYYDEDYKVIPYTIMPKNTTVTDVTWASSDEGVATVDEQGKIKCLHSGTTKITVTTKNGKSATCIFNVYDVADDRPDVEDITLNKTSLQLNVGSTAKLTPSITPEKATTPLFNFEVIDPQIATVTDAGVVTGISEGSTYVVVRSENENVTKYCKVTVKKPVTKGAIYTANGVEYRVTKVASEKATGGVTVIGVSNRKCNAITVPNTIKLKSRTYSVSAIGKNALKNLKKLQVVTIGKNVKTIGASAFQGDKKLKRVYLYTKKLKEIDKNALKGIYSNCQINVWKQNAKAYKKLLTKKTGFRKTMKLMASEIRHKEI